MNPEPDPIVGIRNQKRRGRLKVYLGMAAGVGKTYGMLADAKEAKARGRDVVIGYLEPHGRVATEAMAEGLERLPLREIDHKGVRLTEFDVDAALRRHPEVILVDELAHTNAPGSRHSKRWQDVEELLDAQIDVVTTVNVQHIESLRDVVAQITHVVVQETVPDKFFDHADEIELVDIPPEELRQRLKEGKIYVPEKVEQALEGFFRKGNLLALRELALRHTAERVDAELRQTRSDSRITEPWHAGERILVCVAPNRMAQRVVRAARRLATNLHAEFIAVSVESLRQRGASESARAQLDDAMVLAEELGARTATLSGDDIVAELLAFARRENVTTIVMGKPIRARWKEILFGSVVDATVRSSGDIDILVITGQESQGTVLFSRPRQPTTDIRGYAEILLAVGIATGLGFLSFGTFDLANVIMLYLVGVVAISLRHGLRESLVATLLSILTFNYCFVEPRYSFAVSDAKHILTFGIMLAVSMLLSGLTLRLKEITRSASQRERTTSALYDLSRRLAASRKKEEMTKMAAERASGILSRAACVWLLSDAGLTLQTPSTNGFENEVNEGAVAQWVVDNGKPAGNTTDTLSGVRGLYLPLVGTTGALGVLGVDMSLDPYLDTAQRHMVESIASQLAGALERAQFAKESHEAFVRVETERMRGDLLSAVSHDLRTPLASIEGASSGLLNQPELSERSRELTRTISEESARMGRLIRNLLDMTRVQGQVELNLDWYSLDELVANAVERTASLFSEPVTLVEPSKPILIHVDGVLIEQVVANLLENAARHAGRDAHVTVRLAAEKHAAVLEVEDDGPGIAPGKEQTVFDRFYREGLSGFGLGLAICKAAIEAHGGKIQAMTGQKGARFRIEIPMGVGPNE